MVVGIEGKEVPANVEEAVDVVDESDVDEVVDIVAWLTGLPPAP